MSKTTDCKKCTCHMCKKELGTDPISCEWSDCGDCEPGTIVTQCNVFLDKLREREQARRMGDGNAESDTATEAQGTSSNPIYLCFCKATERKPSDNFAIYHFTGWIMEQQKTYMQEHGIKGHFPEAHTEAFHVWLKKKYLGGADNAPEN